MMNLYNHRLELIKRLLDLGYQVVIAAPRGGEEKNLEKIGCKFIQMDVDNRGTNIKKDLKLIKDLITICKKEKPDIILTFYTKTNIYGGLVARWMKIPYIENICGLGTSLVGQGLISKVMSNMYKQALKKASYVFFQNQSNVKFIRDKGIYKGNFGLLPGSGVSLERYEPLPYPQKKEVEFFFCSRILKEKGIEEYLQAGEEIKKKYPSTVFHIAGPCEPAYESLIKKKHQSGLINYHGKIMDIHPLLEQTHCTVLPSYYPEGMANILLESAASARPLITTSLPGCKETVEDGVTGYVVPEKDTGSLAMVMERFINLSQEEKKSMGIKGRQKMEKEFNREIVIKEYVKKIKEIIS